MSRSVATWPRLAVLSVALVAIVLGLPYSHAARTETLVTSSGSRVGSSLSDEPAFIRATVEQVAAANGEDNVRSLTWTLSDRLTTNSTLLETEVPTAQPVIVILATGDFTAHSVSRPQGTEPPAGGWMLLVVDRTERNLVDFAVLEKEVDLTKLGTVNREVLG